jgi:hypothetical protein
MKRQTAQLFRLGDLLGGKHGLLSGLGVGPVVDNLIGGVKTTTGVDFGDANIPIGGVSLLAKDAAAKAA